MEVRYSDHALKKMESRGLSRVMVEMTLGEPDSVLNGRAFSQIAQKSLNSKLVRVVFRMEGESYLVITAYLADRSRYEVFE